MNSILSAAQEIQDFFQSRDWPFCFIGGVAVLRWGRPRTTQDVDVSLFVEMGNEQEVVSQILQKFSARVEGALQFALENRVVLAKSRDNVAYDIALAQFEFEREIIQRASFFEFSDDIELLTVSAEDLVVMKSFAGRDQDWIDVAGIVEANNDLDIEYARRQLGLLVNLQSDNDALQKLDRIVGE